MLWRFEIVLPVCSGRLLETTVLRLERAVLLRRARVIRRVVRAALARIFRYFGISAQWMRALGAVSPIRNLRSFADSSTRIGAVGRDLD